MLRIDDVQGKGRGAIATQSVKRGDLIEAAPVCTLPPEQRKVIAETALSEYYFVMPTEYHSSKDQASGHIVFGLSSFCNHSGKPNARVDWISGEHGLWAHLTALEDIQVGEEVTICYTNLDEYPLATLFVETV